MTTNEIIGMILAIIGAGTVSVGIMMLIKKLEGKYW